MKCNPGRHLRDYQSPRFWLTGLLLASFLVGTSMAAAGKDNAASENGSDNFAYSVIGQEQIEKLKAIRDAYGSIPNLDSIYEDRTHATQVCSRSTVVGFLAWTTDRTTG